MSENGEIYTGGQKFYTAASSDKFHLCLTIQRLQEEFDYRIQKEINYNQKRNTEKMIIN